MRHGRRSGKSIASRSTRLLWLAAITIASALGLAFRQVDRLPRSVSFEPADPANFAFHGVVGERCERSYTITNVSRETVRVFVVRVGGDADFVARYDSKGVRLAPGEHHIVTVTYAPQRAGAQSRGALTFSVGRGNRTEAARIEFTGQEGRPCKPPPDDQGGGGGGAGGDDAGVVNDPGFTDFGAVPQDPAQPTICVRFHFVGTGWGADGGQAPLPEKLRECIRVASGWYSGVEFELRPASGVPEVIASPDNDADYDVHCINVYIVHDDWFEDHAAENGDNAQEAARKAGHTETRPPRGPAWTGDQARPGVGKELKDGGANGDYVDQIAIGTRITIEAGAGLCSTLAHELGHALGLGAGPNNAHRQPDDNAPITDGDRLLHPSGNGSKLTDAEQKVARRVAQHMLDTTLLPCDATKGAEEQESEPPAPPGNDFRRATLFNQGETLRFELRPAYAFDPREAQPQLRIELDGDLDGVTDLDLHYRYTGEAWQVESAPLLPDSLSLPEPALARTWHSSSAAAARAISVDVPRAALPGAGDTIGWRTTLSSPAFGAAATIPAGFDWFDTTLPALAFTVDPPDRVLRDRRVTLRGTLTTSRTFQGDVDISMVLTAAQQRWRVPLTNLAAPVPTRWSAEVVLPDSLADGRYDVTLHAGCADCNLNQYIAARLVVGVDRKISMPLRIVALLLGLTMLALLALRLSRR